MCELLGMNCNVPTDICFSFEGFHARGGRTADHTDGWGIGFFEGPGCRLFLDVKSSIESPVAEFVRRYPIRSTNVVAHIRKATQGCVTLENTHPFIRELWGQYWLFAHNGNLERFAPRLSRYYQPVGDTDSERAFCYLLGELREQSCSQALDNEPLFQNMLRVTAGIRAHGSFNYLLSNGSTLFAHCSTHLYYIIREAPFTAAHLVDEDLTVDFSTLTQPSDRVIVIATQPLTDNEQWTRLSENTLMMFKDGQVLASRTIA